MAEPGWQIDFDGLTGIESFEMTLSRGVAPSRGVLTVAYVGQTIPDRADLVLTYDATTITLTDCVVAEPWIEGDQRGRSLRIVIEDRRWRWKFAGVVGRYNVRSGQGDSVKHEQTPQQLATMLFDALGEAIYDVSALPNSARPFVDWRNTSCDIALAELLDPLGCDVAPDLSTGGFKIVKLGTGAALPSTGWIEDSAVGIDVANTPERIRLVTGPVRYQCKFLLEPVGVEYDGRWLPINDLSYKPLESWEEQSDVEMADVVGSHLVDGATIKNRDLALATVFKCWRISYILGGTGPAKLNPPGFVGYDTPTADQPPHVTVIDSLLPLQSELNDTYTDPYTNQKRGQRPKIEGQWEDAAYGDFWGNTRIARPYKRGFDIDYEHGIVTFGEPMVRVAVPPPLQYPAGPYRQPNPLATPGAVLPAVLILTAVCEVEWENNHQKDYYVVDRDKDGVVSPELIARYERPELNFKYTARYGNFDGATLVNVEDNQSTIDAQAGYYLDALESELEPPTSGTASYADLLAVSPDGAIEQVAWSFGGDGVTTRISRGTRINAYLPSYKEAKKQARLQRAAERDARIGERQAERIGRG